LKPPVRAAARRGSAGGRALFGMTRLAFVCVRCCVVRLGLADALSGRSMQMALRLPRATWHASAQPAVARREAVAGISVSPAASSCRPRCRPRVSLAPRAAAAPLRFRATGRAPACCVAAAAGRVTCAAAGTPEPRDEHWERRFQDLKAFIAAHGSACLMARMKRDTPAHAALAQWVATQRFAYRKGTLSA
jgi:hypothetical protein